MIRKCQSGGFYRTAGWIASTVALWSVAVETAHRVDVNLAKHYIHRAPRSLQSGLCRLVDIELELADGEAARTPTREAVCRELRKVARDLDDLGKQAQESAKFLQELEAWGTKEESPENSCGICRRLVFRSFGYRFPCGHVFHEHCLTKAVQELMSLAELDALNEVIAHAKRSAVARQRKEELIAVDCVLCGERAVDRVYRPLVQPDSSQWSLDLADLAAPSAWRLRGKG
jgi:hypothetical protein